MKFSKLLAPSCLAVISVLSFQAKAVVYGTDDRKDLYEIDDPLIRSQVESTAAFSILGLIVPDGSGDYKVLASPLGQLSKLCPGEKFADQRGAGACSGTLVSSKHILTAGHCMENQKQCDDRFVMFGFHTYLPGENLTTIPGKNVYKCKKLLTRKQNGLQDFALIELDREVTDRRPVRLATRETVRAGQRVRMIGYPDCIPSKVVSNGYVRAAGSQKFVSNLDAFKGNSGSGIFSQKTGDLVGILFMGNPDYRWDHRRECRRVAVFGNNEGRGEDATQVASIWRSIRPYLEGTNVEVAQ